MKSKVVLGTFIACSFAIPAGFTQDQGDDSGELVEEIIVTGSFIKRSKFDVASPVEVLDAEEIQASGYTNIGNFVRDLTYTANVDTVANVLGGADGGQDSNSARFNLRGLGTSSTLTLFDGRRVLNSGAVAGILPDIALERAEVILDGGAATYGTDAVAGVVNLIPIQNYEGTKVRGFYTRDHQGDVPEYKASVLFGKAFESFHMTAALEYSERPDGLYRTDRPEYLRADNDSSTFGNPGSYTIFGFGPKVDPECGTANTGAEDDGQPGAYPSGVPDLTLSLPFGLGTGPAICTLEYGQFQDYKRPNEDLIVYLNATYDINDSISLIALLNHNDRVSKLISSPTTGERGTNNLITVPNTGVLRHPNNPFPTFYGNYSPRGWRPFSGNGATQPSYVDQNGASNTEFNYVTTSLALGTEFDIANTSWSGETYLTSASTTTDISGFELNGDRLAQAFRGEGGPGANQWFNPFFSASPTSLNYGDCEVGLDTLGAPLVDPVSGNNCSANEQGLVNWFFSPFDFQSLKTDYWSVEGFVTGDLFEMPAGPVAVAVGAQYRSTEFETNNSPLGSTASAENLTASSTGGPASLDYNQAVVNGVTFGTAGESAVTSAFFELDVPILDNLGLIIAARHEDFKDLDLTATVPKVSLRYQPSETIALRASYGEGFLAPTVTEVTSNPSPGCGELFVGNDPSLGGTLNGSLSCTNGNPDTDPEESTIKNIGITWQATDDLELSLDYQRIEYSDRIIRLGTTDTLNLDLAAFLETQNLTLDQWEAIDADLTGTPAQAQAATDFIAWANSSSSNPLITRDATDGDVQQVVRLPGNVAEVNVNVLDFRFRWGTDIGSAYLSTNWSTTYYTKYEYLDAFDDRVEGAGRQNGDTNIAPPLARFRHQLRVNLLAGNHIIGLTGNHMAGMKFDASTGPTFGPPLGVPAPKDIKPYGTIDLRYSFEYDGFDDSVINFSLGANNATNKKAQRLPVVGGLESRIQDPTGRTYYAELAYEF